MPKTELITTLNKIREHGPCADGWEKLLTSLGKTKADDEPLTLTRILESNGIDDATWALRAVDTKYDNAIRLFACFCAKYSLDIFERERPDDKRPRQAIETAERFARGGASKEDLAAAGDAAWAAARDAARAAAWAAAGDAAWAAARDAAGDAAWAAARAAARDAARDAARAAARDAAGDAARDAARDAAWDHFGKEFVRLCRLEGEYGVVVGPESEDD